MIECPLCNNKFNNRRTFGLHLSTTHRSQFNADVDKERVLVYTLFGKDDVELTIHSYTNTLFCIDTLPIDIAKYITLLGIKRTSCEERKTHRYKNKYLSSIQLRYGCNITNISQVKSVQEKKEHTAITNYGSYENYLSNNRENMKIGYEDFARDTTKVANARSKAIATCITKYGVDNPAKSLPIRAKMGESQKVYCSLLSEDELRARTANARAAVCSRGGFSSKPEKRVRKSFVDLDICVEYNKNIWNYNWDIVFDRCIIEVQGVMWHAKPDRYKATDLIMGKLLVADLWKKDKKKHAKARSQGYTVIEIWEDEIAKCNDDELTTLVTERLTENGYKF